MDQFELPVAVADELHADLALAVDCELRTAYEGRGMYGETCLGFVTPDAARLAYHLGVLMADWQPSSDEWGEVDTETLMAAFAGHAHSDQMGYDMIVYWPTIKVVP